MIKLDVTMINFKYILFHSSISNIMIVASDNEQNNSDNIEEQNSSEGINIIIKLLCLMT